MNEDEPKKQLPYEIGQKLDDLSVGELNDIIALLRSEIERLEHAADTKLSSLSAAAAFFKN